MAITIFTVLLLFQLCTTTTKAFTMALIPRDSIHPNNLTESQRFERLIQQSKDYAQFVDGGPLMLRPPMSEKRMLYLVKVSIGSGFAATPYTLHFDLGSDLTWIQCLPCNPCFPQPNPTFNPEVSTTFHILPRNHRLCLPPYGHLPDNGMCTYLLRYLDNTSAYGLVAQERFTFLSDAGGGSYEIYQGLAFGCTLMSEFPEGDTGDWDGILGMGHTSVSIVSQLGELISHRFSYCLVKPESGLSSYLSFGPEPTREYQTTPIDTYEDSGYYYLRLEDITVGGHLLNLPPDTFRREGPHEGGFVVDTGASATHLIGTAYTAVENYLLEYFDNLHIPREGPWSGLDLCYRTPASPEMVLPSMVFHFQDANYEIPWDNVFWLNDQGVFCWGMLKSDSISLFGARQMSNYRFAFNLESMVLSFASENCGDEGLQA